MTTTTQTGPRCSVCALDDVELVNTQLMAGVGVRELAVRHGISTSAISRHSQRHMVAARQDAARDSAAAPADLLARLVDLADSARATRLRLEEGGSPNAQARASDVEIKVLQSLLGLYGVNDTTTVTALQQAERLTHGVAKFAIANPMAAGALIREIRAQKLTDFADQLEALVTKQNASEIERN